MLEFKIKKPGSYLLSHLISSIIGVRELDFRVRYGNGYYLSTMATRHYLQFSQLSCMSPPFARGLTRVLRACTADFRHNQHILKEKEVLSSDNMVKPHDRLVLIGSYITVFGPSAYQPDSLSGVFRGVEPPGMVYLEVGFPLRCFQRLSLPNVATQRLPLAG